MENIVLFFPFSSFFMGETVFSNKQIQALFIYKFIIITLQYLFFDCLETLE